ncbi:hypothetical protein L9F63_007070, partial [Diploptera punctata]
IYDRACFDIKCVLLNFSQHLFVYKQIVANNFTFRHTVFDKIANLKTTLEDAGRSSWRNVGELQASRARPTARKSSTRSSEYIRFPMGLMRYMTSYCLLKRRILTWTICAVQVVNTISFFDVPLYPNRRNINTPRRHIEVTQAFFS